MPSKPHLRATPPRLTRKALSLLVIPKAGSRHHGLVKVGHAFFPCALGRGGLKGRKQEGDGATPRGRLAVGSVWWRADHGPPPVTGLRLRRIAPSDGWCDDPGHRRYNRPIQRPFPASHERMWREDALYDVVVELGWNAGPIVRGRGSAIFLHVARPGFTPTEGCIALRRGDLRKLLARCGAGTTINVAAAPRRARSRP